MRYQLKTPYRDGTTHVIFEPLDFIAKLAALVPKPRVNLTRYHGLFAPNSRHRARVTPAKRGKGNSPPTPNDLTEQPPRKRRASMRWAQRLKRVFDIETCRACGGAVRICCACPNFDADHRGFGGHDLPLWLVNLPVKQVNVTNVTGRSHSTTFVRSMTAISIQPTVGRGMLTGGSWT